MRKVFLFLLTFVAMVAEAQTKGNFEVLDLGSFKLHVYNTNDALGDASYIIEGKTGLVTLEQPLFKDNVSKFDTYVVSLNKPVQKIITNYHVGGTGNHDVVMIEGMPDFVKGAVYGGMMQNFAKIFGDAITPMPTGKTEEVHLGSIQNWGGVRFSFQKGASTDFPAANIIIGDKVYYTHWAPAKSHVSHLQISSLAAIDVEIAEAEKALKSGCEYFIGGHGGIAKSDMVKFKIDYLKTMKRTIAANKTADSFIVAMKKAYPNLPGEAGLTDLANALYK